jgi:hydrogenase nickel incorporation protein HypA/HybF
MHERALMERVVRQVLAIAAAEAATRVTAVRVRLGALSHMTPEHFADHFREAAKGTIAEGARIRAILDTDIHAPHAQGVLVESIEIEEV